MKPAQIKPSPGTTSSPKPNPAQAVKGSSPQSPSTSTSKNDTPSPKTNLKIVKVTNDKGEEIEIKVDPTKVPMVKINHLEPNKNTNTFPCYLGFLLPVAIHHTRCPINPRHPGWKDWQSYEKANKVSVSEDWFTHLEKLNLSPVHHRVKGGTSTLLHREVLLSLNHTGKRNDIGEAFNWLNDCIDQKADQYTKEYQNGLVLVFLKEDWQLFKAKGMRIHVNMTVKGNIEDRKRLGPQFSIRFLPRLHMNEFCTAWANHCATNYSHDQKAPCNRPEADRRTNHKPTKKK